MSIPIIGLMFGTVTAAIISVLTFFSDALKFNSTILELWEPGFQAGMRLCIYHTGGFGISGLLFIFKPLDALLLGENYAKVWVST